MLTFAGKKYAKTNTELLNSLFQTGGTANGFYKPVKDGIKLYSIVFGGKELAAFIHKGGFVVTAYTYKGKSRYMCGISSITESWLGTDSLRYSQVKEECFKAIESK